MAMKALAACLLSVTFTSAPSLAQTQAPPQGCGELQNTFGPYDYREHVGTHQYRTNPNNPLRLVEIAHFRPEMEALRHGGQGPLSSVGPEFDYTLRAFPNHHRALVALLKLSARDRTDQPNRMRYNVGCYFERAIRFVPDDTIVRMLYAGYLGENNRLPEAIKHLTFAAESNKENPFTQYNVGLIYLDMKQFDMALKQAHIAYGMGMQRPELKDFLVRGGHWRDPPALQASPATAAASQ